MSWNDFDDLLRSYNIDPSDPDHLDKLLYQIGAEDDETSHIYDPDGIVDELVEYDSIDDYYEEYDDDLNEY